MDSVPTEPQAPIISVEDISLNLPSGTFSDDDLFSIYGGSPAPDLIKSRSLTVTETADPKLETQSTNGDDASQTDSGSGPTDPKTADASPETKSNNNTTVETNRTDPRKAKLFQHLQDEFCSSNRFKDLPPADKGRKMEESVQDGGYWSDAASSTKTISPNIGLQSKPFIPSLSSRSGTPSSDMSRKNIQDKRNYICCFPGLSPISMPWLGIDQREETSPSPTPSYQ